MLYFTNILYKIEYSLFHFGDDILQTNEQTDKALFSIAGKKMVKSSQKILPCYANSSIMVHC